MIKKILTAVALSSMIATPVLANNASIGAVERSGANVSSESDLHAPGSIVGIVLVLAVIAGGIILIATDDDDNDVDMPVSP